MLVAQSGLGERSLQPRGVLPRRVGKDMSSSRSFLTKGCLQIFCVLGLKASEGSWDEIHRSIQMHLFQANIASMECFHLLGYSAFFCAQT